MQERATLGPATSRPCASSAISDGTPARPSSRSTPTSGPAGSSAGARALGRPRRATRPTQLPESARAAIAPRRGYNRTNDDESGLRSRPPRSAASSHGDIDIGTWVYELSERSGTTRRRNRRASSQKGLWATCGLRGRRAGRARRRVSGGQRSRNGGDPRTRGAIVAAALEFVRRHPDAPRRRERRCGMTPEEWSELRHAAGSGAPRISVLR